MKGITGVEDEGDHRHDGAEAGADAGGQGLLSRISGVGGGAELLDRECPEHRVGVPGQAVGQLVRRLGIDPLELVEERELLLLLLRMLGDLLALALDVRGRHLGLRALGQERSGGHR
jgi:hypothetical protein